MTLSNSGVYLAEYRVYPTSNNFSDTISLYLNGSELSGTRRSLENNTMNGTSIIFQAPAGSTLNIELVSSAPVRFFDEAESVIVYLVISQIA